MNELEARGYRVTDLNKDGLSANADLIAAKGGKIWQIQVRGSTNTMGKRWWIQYGYCTPEIIAGKIKMFNRHDSFYTAQHVVLVAVRSPSEYRCFVLPVKEAEKAAQLLLDRSYRRRRRNGKKKKPGKMWFYVEESSQKRAHHVNLDKEREILHKWENVWGLRT
ncbi:MAG TPA: hypothetical protein VJK73_00255 [Candidatus Paceibacterota bacterium]